MGDRAYNVALVGATGLIGESVREQLLEQAFPLGTLHLLASQESAGERVSFYGHHYKLQTVDGFDFTTVDVAIFTAGAEISDRFVPHALEAGCAVVDVSSRYCMDPQVPTRIPGINDSFGFNEPSARLLRTPVSLAAQLLPVLAVLDKAAGVERVTVSTYEAVSAAGKKGIDALAKETALLLNARPVDQHHFAKQIAFNALPQVGVLMPDGRSSQEYLLEAEIKRVLGDSVAVNATCVTVPVFHGSSAAVQVEMRTPFSAAALLNELEGHADVEVIDHQDPERFATAVSDASGSDRLYVSRIRDHQDAATLLSFWLCADATKHGAAPAAVRLAQQLLGQGE